MIPTERPTPTNTENYAELLALGKEKLRLSVDEIHATVKKRITATHEHMISGAHPDANPQTLMLGITVNILEDAKILQMLDLNKFLQIEQAILLIQALIIQTVPVGMRWEDYTRQMIAGLNSVREEQIKNVDHPAMESRIVATEIAKASE